MNLLDIFLIEIIVFETVFIAYNSYRKVKNAERTIIKQIEALEWHRIPFTKAEIIKTIETLYLSGTFSERRKNKLLCILDNKYNILYDEYIKRTNEDYERSYKAKMKSFYGDDFSE